MNGTDLLAEFRATRAEKAFSELVRRYTNLVYSIARRRVADMTLAQEVSQIVFIRLAKVPPKLASEGQLLGWLHRTTVHASIDLWRSETRRRVREQHAVAMQTNPTEEVTWNEMSPVLDEALNDLDDSDRHVILLRFFEQKTMADLGRIFEVSEDAAKMRVSRAIGRLRTRISGLGATCSATLLGALLYERSVEAAPSSLAITLAAIRIATPAGFAGGLISLWSAVSGASGAKLASVTLVAAIAVGATALLLLHTTTRNSRVSTSSDLAQKGALNSALFASASSDTNGVSDSANPDPAKLLQGVIRARQRIASGVIDFEIFTFGSVTRGDDTNRFQLKIQFEDGRLLGEIFKPEFAYVTPIPGGPEAEEIAKRADQMPREQAMREGLIDVHQTHSVVFYDGQAETWYRESQSSAYIDEPGRSADHIFDPRCVGLNTVLSVEDTLDRSLAFFKRATNVTLIGTEFVESNPAWHIQLRFNFDYDYSCNFWIDTLHPTRALKMEENLPRDHRVTLCRYSDANVKDPLPTEVSIITHRPNWRFEERIVRHASQYNATINPACWTLDGLHMKVGTPVSDYRNHRILGYWTGAGLSQFPPSKDKSEPAAPNRAELLTLLENEPASPAAFGAALWILTNSPDGADLQKAANVILESHIQNPDLVGLTQELERMRPSCSSNLLQAMLDQNPNKGVRGKACMALATMRKDAAGFGTNTSATAEAEKLLGRVITEFGSVSGQSGKTLAELAQPELSELRKLTIGKVAPEITGTDLFGRSMKLSDYRGQVVALLFWSATCFTEYDAREVDRLVERTDGKAFALIGIYADDNTEKAKAAAQKFGMKWPSFEDAREGPISKTYNINAWPTIYVLDRKGVIRYRALGFNFISQIAAAADKLLKE
jgi:RNA polymerase sigma factor (sigma-70 family)